MGRIRRALIVLARLMLWLIGIPAGLLGMKFFRAGIHTITQHGDTTAGCLFVAGGLAVLASGLFFLWQAVRLK